MQGPEDYYYPWEDEWVYDDPVDEYHQEIAFRIIVPFDAGAGGPDYSIIDDPPGFLGGQALTVSAVDISDTERFLEGIRAISPVFDPEDPCKMICHGQWLEIQRVPHRHARVETYTTHVCIKLVY